MSNLAVKLTNVSKKYVVSHQKSTLVGNILGKKANEEFWALKDINLKIKRGERIGIIGPNGAGKTTLMKIISGITAPTKGKVAVYESIATLINLQAGFHPDFTGEENIYLNGMLSGMSREEVKEKFDQIVNFADIGNFINAPFYTYSEGMKFRLAFAIAIASECQILIIDEVFTAGDIDFQHKTLSSLKAIQEKRGITTIICSHVPVLVWSYAKKFYAMDKGQITKKSPKSILSIIERENKKWGKLYYKF